MARLTNDLHCLLTQDVLNALFKKSIYTASTFVSKKSALLSNITGLQYDEILKIKDRILAKYSSPLKRGDKHYYEVINHCAVIPTKIEQLDLLLQGGFMTGNIYELCGLEACGKTQICMTIALHISMNTNHEVLFIDTKYDISSQRMLNMLSACNVLNPNEILQKIKICHSTNAFKLLRDLHHIRTAFSEAEEKYLGFKVIIIDSLSVLFQEFHNFIEGLSVLSNIVQVMNLLVSKYHIVILITNFVTSWTPKSTLEESDCEEFINYFFKVETPALGRYWAHVPTTRIMIKRRGCMDECYLTNLKSRYQPIGKTVKICITEAGVK